MAAKIIRIEAKLDALLKHLDPERLLEINSLYGNRASAPKRKQSCGKYNHPFGNMDARRPRVCPSCGILETETEEAKEQMDELAKVLSDAYKRARRKKKP